MYENYIVQQRGFHNTVDKDGNVDGFQFRMRTGYYKGVWLSQLRVGPAIVDGVEYPRESLIWVINGIEYTADEMLKEGYTYWQVDDCATIKVKKPGGLESGYHDVDIKFGWICNYVGEEMEDPEYGVNFHGFNNNRRLLLV